MEIEKYELYLFRSFLKNSLLKFKKEFAREKLEKIEKKKLIWKKKLYFKKETQKKFKKLTKLNEKLQKRNKESPDETKRDSLDEPRTWSPPWSA